MKVSINYSIVNMFRIITREFRAGDKIRFEAPSGPSCNSSFTCIIQHVYEKLPVVARFNIGLPVMAWVNAPPVKYAKPDMADGLAEVGSQ